MEEGKSEKLKDYRFSIVVKFFLKIQRLKSTKKQ